MRIRHFAAGFLVALILSAATAWATSQSQAVAVNPVTPRVIEDVGFRVEGLRGGTTPVGTIVVRIEGQWVEAEVKLPGRNLVSSR